jgi:hypothetical protein
MTPKRKIKDNNTNPMVVMMTPSTTITMRKRGLILLILTRMTNGMPIKSMTTMINIIETLRKLITELSNMITIASTTSVVATVIIIKLKLITSKEKGMSSMILAPSEVAAELEGTISSTDKDLTLRGMRLLALMNMVMELLNIRDKTSIIMIEKALIKTEKLIGKMIIILKRRKMSSISIKNVREITRKLRQTLNLKLQSESKRRKLRSLKSSNTLLGARFQSRKE